MSGLLEFTVLGSGSSGGVPRADGEWGACDPAEPRNRRSRCSLLVRRPAAAPGGEGTTVLVDTSPDLRLQTAAAGATRLDAVLYTHDHADQSHGIDDVRAFALRHRTRIACYADAPTRRTLLDRFGYCFEAKGGYPAICEMHDLPPHGREWAVDGPSGAVPVCSAEVDHGHMPAIAFRFGAVGYAPDVVALPPPALARLRGLDVLIVDALRERPHPTHAHLGLALAWIEELRPRRAILTNMHIDLDYAALKRRLPPGVEPAFDGLRFTSES
ncbi:MAG: MBL fold metallo-hydrolase [Caulobacteraceae bacterium]|nr:MBL fold metallo-hydrolase [Caulobacter sp.]